jgi:transposase
MSQEHEARLPVQDQTIAGDLFISVEMSRSKWVTGVHTPLVEMIAMLNRLKGIGMNDATILEWEAFWRDFRNRREVGPWNGLAPLAHQPLASSSQRARARARRTPWAGTFR